MVNYRDIAVIISFTFFSTELTGILQKNASSLGAKLKGTIFNWRGASEHIRQRTFLNEKCLTFPFQPLSVRDKGVLCGW